MCIELSEKDGALSEYIIEQDAYIYEGKKENSVSKILIRKTLNILFSSVGKLGI